MALRNILVAGEPTLQRKSRPVTNYNARLHELLDDMRDTLQNAGGVGLAAPQVGVLRRAILILETNVGEDQEEYFIELINPELTMRDGEQTGPEGCLSLPGKVGIVARPLSVVVRAFDRDGNAFELESYGITARALCHEIDHLEGVLYTSLVERMLTDEEVEALAYADEEDFITLGELDEGIPEVASAESARGKTDETEA